MEKIFVKDLKPSTTFKSTFLVREKNLGVDKKGNSFLSVVLSDKTGSIDARVWDQAEHMNELFEVDDFVLVKGIVQKFQNRNQAVIQGLEIMSPTSVRIADFLPTTQNDIEKMFAELEGIVKTVEDVNIQAILLNTLADPEVHPLFKRCPAAKTVHHAYIGGLLEHTLSMCNVMCAIAPLYPQLNRDLLIFGCIYHDIGKIWELSFDTEIGYTDVGRLVGHIPMGSELVERKAKEIPHFPFELKNILKHIVLSHHGLLEYGSPKRPKFLEAVVVGMVDDLDSKMQSLTQLLETQSSESAKWTGYNSMHDRYFYTEILKTRLKGMKPTL